MSNERKDQIESLNFAYSVHDFAKDWRGVRKYEEKGSTRRSKAVHMPGNSPRLIPSEQNTEPGMISQWFIDRYGDDPDHLYARYMRFTMLANVFADYEKEIRDAGLPIEGGYSKELLPVLLKLRVRPGDRDIARFDPRDVQAAIRRAASQRRRNS